ncbi:MAG: hypothetical protein R2747_12565 [Pyrinomonadaceae bacterium]
MIELSENVWRQLEHAYGEASDIPSLLKQLSEYPVYESYKSEPYFSLWSALCHQGDVYSASYAAVPHIVRLLVQNPDRATVDYVLLPICIEIARLNGNGPEINTEVEESYFSSLKEIIQIMPQVSVRDEGDVRVLAAAVAVVNGNASLGDAILELSNDVLEEFSEWFYSR